MRRIDGGMFQYGFTMTYCIAWENTGVGVSGFPTITRLVWTTRSRSTSAQ